MQKLTTLSLRHNFSWTFAGNIVYAACQWGILVLLAKLGNPAMVGQFTLGFAITAPVMMFTNLQLRVVQATDARQQYYFGDYLGLRILSTALALLVILIITVIGQYRFETSLVICLIGLAKAVESMSDVFYGLIQQHERMDRIAVSMMIKGPMSLLFFGVGIHLTGQVAWGVVGLTVAWVLVLLHYDIQSGALLLQTSRGEVMHPTAIAPHLSSGILASQTTPNLLRPRWHFSTFGKLVWLALPLGFVMLLISLNSNIPQYFIEGTLGERSLGIFAAIAYLMVAGNMVVNALGQSASPRLAKYYASGKGSAFRTLLLKLVGIGALLGGVAILVALGAAREILTLIYRAEYAQQANLFVWLMVAAGIGYVASFLGYGITAARYFRIQIPLFTAVTGTSAIACLWLVPIKGLQGAAIALILGALVQVVFSSGAIFYALHQLQKTELQKPDTAKN